MAAGKVHVGVDPWKQPAKLTKTCASDVGLPKKARPPAAYASLQGDAHGYALALPHKVALEHLSVVHQDVLARN